MGFYRKQKKKQELIKLLSISKNSSLFNNIFLFLFAFKKMFFWRFCFGFSSTLNLLNRSQAKLIALSRIKIPNQLLKPLKLHGNTQNNARKHTAIILISTNFIEKKHLCRRFVKVVMSTRASDWIEHNRL